MEILQWLHKMLGGGSPITGYLGSITMILTGAQLVTAMLQEQGVPTNTNQWIVFLLGVGSRFAKDANRTNSQHPAAESVPVPAVSASPVTVMPAGQ